MDANFLAEFGQRLIDFELQHRGADRRRAVDRGSPVNDDDPVVSSCECVGHKASADASSHNDNVCPN
jgi:hypothetical protein